MAYGDKVVAHPDKAEIIERLTAGESTEAVAKWLKIKYNNNRNRWLSSLTLQRFRHQVIGLKGEVLREIQSTVHEVKGERIQEQRQYSLQNSPEYQKVKETVAKDILNREQLTLDIHDKLWTRIQLLENEKLNYKTDAVIVEYIGQLRQLLLDHHKITMDYHKLANKGDGQTNVQVVIQKAEDQINLLKKCVIETLQEMMPDHIPIFLEKLKTRIDQNLAGVVPDNTTIVNVQVNNNG